MSLSFLQDRLVEGRIVTCPLGTSLIIHNMSQGLQAEGYRQQEPIPEIMLSEWHSNANQQRISQDTMCMVAHSMIRLLWKCWMTVTQAGTGTLHVPLHANELPLTNMRQVLITLFLAHSRGTPAYHGPGPQHVRLRTSQAMHKPTCWFGSMQPCRLISGTPPAGKYPGHGGASLRSCGQFFDIKGSWSKQQSFQKGASTFTHPLTKARCTSGPCPLALARCCQDKSQGSTRDWCPTLPSQLSSHLLLTTIQLLYCSCSWAATPVRCREGGRVPSRRCLAITGTRRTRLG